MESFAGKTVLVTGGAGGIGYAVCRRFAADGAGIALLDADPEALGQAVADLERRGVPVHGVVCDVSDPAAAEAALSTVLDRFGGIDVLVNNAGITLRDAFSRTGAAGLEKVMGVNFFGAVHVTVPALESLTARRGMIVVMSSIAGFSPLPGRSGYCASKYALHGLFETAAVELKSAGVHVMIVCPTFVETNLQCRAIGGDGRLTDHPQSTTGKCLSAEAVAEAIHRGAVRRRPLLVLTPMGKAAYWISRLSPRWYRWIVSRRFAAELRRAD